MASPFRFFRKQQKVFMAFLAIMAIIAFTILGIVLDLLQERRNTGPKNPVVATTQKYGDLTQRDIGMMQDEHAVLGNFLQVALETASQGDPTFMQMHAQAYLQNLTLGKVSEEDAVNHWLMVQKARELNLVVSDATISAFLRDLTGNRLADKDFQELFRRFRMPEEFIFNAIEKELLVANLTDMLGVNFLDFLRSATPAQRWDYFQRLNRNVNLEVVPVSVAKFVDEKADPGDPELKKLFEIYKNQFYFPNSPEPGFRTPQTVAIEYVKADIEKFTDPASVTEEEIKLYYDANRERYRNVELPGLEPDKPAAPAEGKTEEKTETPPAAPDQKTAPTETKPAPAAGGQPTPKTDANTSAAPVRSPFHLVSTNQAPTPEAGKPADATPADKPAATEPATTPAATDAAKPRAEFKPLEEVKDEIRRELARAKVRDRILRGFQPIRANMSQYHKSRIDYEANKEENDSTAAPPPIDLNALANPAPGARWVKKKEGWRLVDAKEAETLPPGETLPAETFGPTQKTKLITWADLGELNIAESRTEGNQLFIKEAFSATNTWLPGISWDLDGNAYLSWKIDEKEERVPEFDEVRDKVLAAWRFIEARKAAQKYADQLADEARKSDKSLAQSIGDKPDVEVSETGPFTWMTSGIIPGYQYRMRPRISAVEHVEAPGDAFMKTAYGLEVGRIGVAMNLPESTVYVMRLIETNPLESVLMASFEVDDFGKYYEVAGPDFQKAAANWIESLKREAGLKWERPAEPLQSDDRQ